MRTPLSPLTLAVARGVLATVTASILAAQTDLRYQHQHWDRPDRGEGLQVSHLVAGERLEFVSAIARCELQTSRKPDQVSVGFGSNQAADVSITVRDCRQNYWNGDFQSSEARSSETLAFAFPNKLVMTRE